MLLFMSLMVALPLAGLIIFVIEERPTQGRHSRNRAPARPAHRHRPRVVTWLTERS